MRRGAALAAVAPAALAALLWLGPASAHAATLKPTGVETAVLVEPDSVPGAGKEHGHGKPEPEAWQFRPTDRGDLRRAKRQAVREKGRAHAPGQSGIAGVTTVDSNAEGLNWSDNASRNLGVPADPTGAAGPDYYFEHVNSVVGTYNRTSLTQTNEDQLDVFTGPTGLDVFDPQIQWDEEAQRWLYVSIGFTSSTNFIVFGWSRTTNPSAGFGGANWCRYAIDTGSNEFDDYPKLGHSDRHILIGANVYDASDVFQGARLWALPKPTNGATTCPGSFGIPFFGGPSSPLQTSAGNDAFTPVPANTVASDGGSGYVAAAEDPLSTSANQIMLWRVGGTVGSPTLEQLGEVGVSSYSVPANAPQPSGSRLDTLDARLTQAVAQPDPDHAGAEAVWTQHTVDGPGGRSVARWYELLPSACSGGSCPAGALAQEGTISDSTAYIFNAAISPTAAGDAAAIEYNRGGSSDLVSIRAQSRVSGDAAGTMSGEQTLVTSSETTNDFSCSGGPFGYCRWGDYAGASPDPADANAVWGTNMYNGPDSGGSSKVGWYTRNFTLTPTASP